MKAIKSLHLFLQNTGKLLDLSYKKDNYWETANKQKNLCANIFV